MEQPIMARLVFVDGGDDQHFQAALDAPRLPIGVTLTIIHEKMSGVIESADLFNSFTGAPIALTVGESLCLLARRNGIIIACAIYEVTETLAPLGLILLVRASDSLSIKQQAAPLREPQREEVAHATS